MSMKRDGEVGRWSSEHGETRDAEVEVGAEGKVCISKWESWRIAVDGRDSIQG